MEGFSASFPGLIAHFFKILMYIFERGEGQRERGTEDPSRLCADSSKPNVGLKLMNQDIMT